MTAQATESVANIKAQALSALQARVWTKHEVTKREADPPMMDDDDEDARILCHVPNVQSEDDFDLVKGVPEKPGPGRGHHFGQVAVVPRKFESLDPSQQIKASLTNWETIYIQFKDPRSGEKIMNKRPWTCSVTVPDYRLLTTRSSHFSSTRRRRAGGTRARLPGTKHRIGRGGGPITRRCFNQQTKTKSQ